MEQKHVLLSALSVGVGVGVGLLSSGQSVSKWVKGTNGSPDLISADQIEYEMMRLFDSRENEVSFENFPYYLSEKTKALLTSTAHVHLKYSEIIFDYLRKCTTYNLW